MRWNFVGKTWARTSSDLSETNRKKPKPKRTRLWTFLCSQRKPSSLQSSREELCPSYRRSRTSFKFGTKRTSSNESTSDLMVNFPRKSTVFNLPHLPSVPASTDNPRKSTTFGFCPTCHNIVLPVLEQPLPLDNQLLPENGWKDVGNIEQQDTKCSDEVQYWPYDANADCNTVYESVYDGTSSLFAQTNDWEWAPDLMNTLVGRTNNDYVQTNLDSSFVYDACLLYEQQHQLDKPYPPWASSTLKRNKRSFTDCETIYDEVASDVEDQECCFKLESIPNRIDQVEVEKDVRPYRKRCAPQFGDHCNRIKRTRREFFVYEE